MTGATIQFDYREDYLLYSEPYQGGIRSVGARYSQRGFAVSFFGLITLSTRRITLYPHTVVSWRCGSEDIPISDDERGQVLTKIENLLGHLGYFVKISPQDK